MVMHC